jgi:hypothetical protein
MNDLIKTVTGVHRYQPALKSNFAREKAWPIAEAASRGYITCLSTGLNQGKWMVTQAGLEFLKEMGA